jgi:hypothetical protein
MHPDTQARIVFLLMGALLLLFGGAYWLGYEVGHVIVSTRWRRGRTRDAPSAPLSSLRRRIAGVCRSPSWTKARF